LAYGNFAEFNVLDTRQYRDDQANGDGTDPPNPKQQDPSRTLTGEEQGRWLLDGLAASGATWNVVAQQVFFAQRDLDTTEGEHYSMDSWDGYLNSRNRILGFVEERNVANPVVLTGDVHNNWASNIKSDFYDENSRTPGMEFVGTSITSGGDGADTSPNQEAVVEENPHIEFFNGQRDYVRCTLAPGEWRADYRALPYVKQPGRRSTRGHPSRWRPGTRVSNRSPRPPRPPRRLPRRVRRPEDRGSGESRAWGEDPLEKTSRGGGFDESPLSSVPAINCGCTGREEGGAHGPQDRSSRV